MDYFWVIAPPLGLALWAGAVWVAGGVFLDLRRNLKRRY